MQNYLRKELFNTGNISNGGSEVIQLDAALVGSLQIQAGAVVAVKTFDNGTSEAGTLTFDTFANTDAGDYVVVYDTAGLAWAIAADLDGTDPEPTGAIWTAIPAARKAQVDLTGLVTAAEVSLAFTTAFNALVGFTAVVTLTDQADGTSDYTIVLHGTATDAAPHNEDDSGAGSIVAAVTTPGVATEVNPATGEITIPAHGYSTGSVGVLTTTGTLPAPLALATPYFVIFVSASVIKLASSLANAEAGTAITITDQGSAAGVNTFTSTAKAGTVTPQITNVAEPVDADWVTLGSATTLTGAAQNVLTQYKQEELTASKFRVLIASGAGSFAFKVILNLKG